MITKCYHLFCNPCLQRIIETRHRKCPVCTASFGVNDVKPVYIWLINLKVYGSRHQFLCLLDQHEPSSWFWGWCFTCTIKYLLLCWNPRKDHIGINRGSFPEIPSSLGSLFLGLDTGNIFWFILNSVYDWPLFVWLLQATGYFFNLLLADWNQSSSPFGGFGSK